VALDDEKYMLLTTFKRDGTAVATPVWVVPLGERSYGFWTSSGSGKAKRLGHTDRVTVQPCNARGQVKKATEPVAATARLVTGPEFATIQEKVKAKYGITTKFTKLAGDLVGILKRKRIPYGDRGVVVTLNA
jgi:PPOX class probable F420-dependent enzyme